MLNLLQIIPITDAMREPHKFPAVLTGVMFFLMGKHVNVHQHIVANVYYLAVLFGGAGALSYLTFGSNINTVVLVNLDSDSKQVQAVRFYHNLRFCSILYVRCNTGPILVFPRYPIISSSATLSRSAYSGEWVVYSQWKGQHTGQVVQESFQVLDGYGLHANKLGWRCGS